MVSLGPAEGTVQGGLREGLGVLVPGDELVSGRVQALDGHGSGGGLDHGPWGLALVGVAHGDQVVGPGAPLADEGHLE